MESRRPNGNCHLILPGNSEEGRGCLYHSNMQFAASTLVYDYQITAVVTVGANLNVNFRSDIERIRFDLLDAESANIKRYFQKAFDFIEKKISDGKNVLVHCSAGVSRSASIIIAYLMKKNQMKYNDAFKYVKAIRKVIQPNQGFVEQLKEYETELAKERNDSINEQKSLNAGKKIKFELLDDGNETSSPELDAEEIFCDA